MDFTAELSAFQGVILSADNIHPFSTLSAKGGNEEKMQFVVNVLFKFLQGKDFYKDGIIESTVTLRKFALYIVFNADLNILEELVDVEDMHLFIWTVPKIPKCLMCELFWNLHMNCFLYEIITLSYPPLAIEVAGAFIDHFKYFNPTECLDKLRKLTTACYTAICRYNFFQFEQNYFSIHLTNEYSNFVKCVKYFNNPPNSHILNALSEDELYKYKGNCFYAAIFCIYECIMQCNSRQEIKPNGLDNIYELTYLKGSVKSDCSSYNVTDTPKDILKVLDTCHIILLDTVKELVMNISVDIFCAWDEFEDNGKTMQQTIGELCYKLRTKLLDITSLCDHPLVSMIEQIARKPVDIKDLINSLDTEKIIANINKNNDEKKDWLNALIYKEQLYKHTDLLEIIETNVANYSEEECYKLYKILKNSSENKDLADQISIKLFQCCSVSDKQQILNDTFINNSFVNMKETVEFNNMLTEIFNKFVVSPNTDFTDILVLFLQNPHRVYTKIFSLAIENSQQTKIMLKAMCILEKFSNYYYDNETECCIIKVTQNTIDLLLDTEVKQDNFVQFIHGLKETNTITGTKLLMLIIMPNIHSSLLSKNINNISIQTKLLRDVYTLEEIAEYRAPILVVLAQVVDILRWKIHTFAAVAPSTLQLVLLYQKSLVTTNNNYVADNESNWLKDKLRNLQPLNMYYYRHLWNPPGNNFLEVISGRSISKETSADEIIILLTQILCSCTQQEWCDIWDSLSDFSDTSKLNIFHESLSAIVMAERSNRTSNTWLCLLYCYRNLIYIIRYKFFKEPLRDEQIMTVIKIIATMPILNDGNFEEIESLLLPLFSYLSERKKHYSIDLSTCTQLKDKNLDNVIKKLFATEQNGNANTMSE